MITPSLRRAGLLLVVASTLSLRASAQSDAAFASALGQGAPSFATLSQFKLKPQKPAAPQAPAADDAVWQKVLAAVKADGKYTPEAGMKPGSFSIKDSTGDPKGEHTTSAITVMGLLNDEGKFEPMGVMLVFEAAVRDPKDGNLRVEQWMFAADVYGSVENAGHGTAVVAPDGKPLSTTPDKLNPSDPKIQAQYDAMLKHWAERKPSGA